MEFLRNVALVICLAVASNAILPNCPNGFKVEEIAIASEISENAVIAAGTTNEAESVKFNPYDISMLNFTQDVISGSVDTRVDIIYYSNTDFVLNLNQMITTTSDFPTRPGRVGASLDNVLLKMVDQKDSLKSPIGRIVNMVIIYASQTSRRKQDSIKTSVATLKNENIIVYLFAVGPAAQGGNLQTLRNNIGSQFVKTLDINGAPGVLSQAMTDAVIKCAPKIPLPTVDPLCDECTIVLGIGKTHVKDRCDQFVHCYKQTDGSVIAVIHQCPHGTLYDGFGNCDHSWKVLKNRPEHCNWCNTGVNQRHTYQDSCAAYWECTGQAGTLDTDIKAYCCADGFEYSNGMCRCPNTQVEMNGRCTGGIPSTCNRTKWHWDSSSCKAYFHCGDVSNNEEMGWGCCPNGLDEYDMTCFDDNTCEDPRCNRQRTLPVQKTCYIRRIRECEYQQLGNEVQRCPPFTEFSEDLCTCKHSSNKNCQASNAGCKENYLNQMKNYNISNLHGYDDELPHYWWTTNKGVIRSSVGTRTAAKYDGSNFQIIEVTKANGHLTSKGIWGRIEYQNDHTSMGTVVLMSNFPCNGTQQFGLDASILVQETYNGFSTQVEIKIKTIASKAFMTDKTESEFVLNLEVPLGTNANADKEITWSFDGVNLSARLMVGGFEVARDSIPATGYIAMRLCGLLLGRGAFDNPNFFIGTMTKVELHMDCPANYPALDIVGIAFIP